MSWRHTTRKNRPRHTVFVCLFADTIHNPPAHHIMPPKRKKKGLAPHVADMSPTCRRHVSMLPNLGRHCVSLRHRRVPDTPNLYQLLPTSTNQPKRTGTLAIIEVLCLSSNNNQEITDMSGTADNISARRDRETVVSSRKPGLARNSRPIFKILYCPRQIIKALLCLKYVVKEVLGGLAVAILARPCETLVSREVSSRKVGLARSLVLAKKPSRPCET